MQSVSFRRRRQAPLAVLGLLALLLLGLARPAFAFDLFARHEVTVHFALPDGMPMAHAPVKVFGPGDPTKVVATGRTDAKGAFSFPADRDGFWSAEASDSKQVARVMIRVGAAPQAPSAPTKIPTGVLYGMLGGLVVLAFIFRTLRARYRRRRRP
jgi:hypothetical protein